jgi:eukaryotic-like serine/threonine-protein kinase
VIGEVFGGHYRFVRLLGQGGMGSVYEAEDTRSGERVAVKMVHADRRVTSLLVRRFHREARTASAVASEHICRVLDVGVAEGSGLPFMVMEYLDGEDLDALLRRTGPLPQDVALRIIGQACAGLARAHEAGIVHRDIKPANLFLARSGEGRITVKILDFGIAKLVQEDTDSPSAQDLTRTGSMLGSPLYMSPEQARGIKGIDHRTDVWSAGVVLHAALLGRTPHHGIEAMGDLIMAICSKPPASIQDRAPWIRPEVAAIVHGSLRISPAERFPTAAAMLDGIRRIVGDDLSLFEEMLGSLPLEAREVIADRFDGTTVTGETSPTSVQVTMTSGRIDFAETMAAPPALADARPSHPGVTRTAEIERPRTWSRARVLAAALGVGLLGLVALGLRWAKGPPARAALPIATATQALPASPKEAGRGRLRIEPGDAVVEIDGVIARVDDGLVELTGPLGSVHHVRLTKGGEAITADVVIAEDGVVPREVRLAAPAKVAPPALVAGVRPSPGGRLGAASASAPAPSSPTPPPPPSASARPEIGERFE